MSKCAASCLTERHRILIADDDRRMHMLLDSHIRSAFDFDLFFARDGNEALAMLETVRPDLLLIDLIMPGLNGIETIIRIRKNPAYCTLPIIFLSSSTDKDRWVEAFEAGANDFVAKPHQRNELLARISTHLKMSCLTQEVNRKNAQLEQDRILAGNVQKQLLPSSFDFSGLTVATSYRAQENIGGDFYDAWSSGGLVWFVMGDICGHGASAAMIMAVCKGLLYSICRKVPTPQELVRELNKMLYNIFEDGQLDMFVTMELICINANLGRGVHVSAGHPSSIIIREGGALERLSATGPAVGLLEDFRWSAVGFQMGREDILLMYTDGIIELRNEKKEFFGDNGFEDLLRPGLSPDDLLGSIIASGLAFCQEEQSDDLALMAIQWNGSQD